MALYDFAKGLILEAGNKVRLMMQEELDIKTKSNPNDLVTNRKFCHLYWYLS